MNGGVPCFKNKGFQDGNSSERICREPVAPTSNGSLWTKNSFDETTIEDDFDFNKEDLQNCFLLESQYLVNDRTKVEPQPEKENSLTKAYSFTSTSTSSKPTTSSRNSNFPDFSDLMSKNLTSQSKSSTCIQFKNNGAKTPNRLNSINTFNGGNDPVRNLNRKISVLEEELLVKQGEVSNLRSELKRKENTLETERSEGRIAIIQAECKGKEKAEKVLTEVDMKMKNLKRELGMAQSDIMFKNREIDELTSKQRQMQYTGHFKNSHVQSISREHCISPSQRQSNFADKFDFGKRKPKLKDAEVQTSSADGELKQRILLKLKSSSKEYNIPTEYLCMNNLSLQNNYSKPEVSSEVIQTSVTFAYKSLENVRLQCSNTDDSSSPWSKEGVSISKWYQKWCHSHLRFLGCLKSFSEVGNLDACLEEILKHVSPLSYKDVIINIENRTAIIETLSNLLNSDGNISQIMLSNVLDAIKLILSSPQNRDVLLAILSLMVTFASCKGIKRRMCLNDGSCIMIKFFDRLEDTNEWGHSLTRVCELFIKLTSELLSHPPPWFTNVECTCPTLLFNNVALYLHSQIKSIDDKSKLWPLLISYVRVVYDWSMTNPSWWAANELYPACRVFLHNVLEQISGPFNPMDQYTTTLLQELIII